MTPRRGTFDERVRRTAVIGLSISVAALVAGLVLEFAGASPARAVLFVGLGGLVVLPIANVIAALVEEIDRRDWAFAAAAVAVLAILAYNVLTSFD